MKIQKLFKEWRSFLDEEEQLIESRLGDVKKKYPNHTKLIDHLSQGDPSGKNKYLAWMAKQLNRMFPGGDKAGQAVDAADQILSAVRSFHKNHQRLDKKDINQYKTLSDLLDSVQSLGLSNRIKRKHQKETAMEGSEIVIDTPDIFVVRPMTAEASCYYGRHTRWCISATDSENYFERYSRDGKVFYMMRLNNLDEDHDQKKMAFVYDEDDGLEEIYDATDDLIGAAEAIMGIADNMAVKVKDDWKELEMKATNLFNEEIEPAMAEHAVNNPIDRSEFGPSEEDFEEVQNDFDNLARNINLRYEFEDDGWQSDIFWTASGQLLLRDLEWMVEFPQNWLDHKLRSKIRDVVDSALDAASVYWDSIEIDFDGEDVDVMVDFSQSDYYGDKLQQFRSYAEDMLQVDDQWNDIEEAVIRGLEKAELIAPGEFMKLQKRLGDKNQTSFEHIDIDINKDDIDIYVPFEIKLHPKLDLKKSDISTIIGPGSDFDKAYRGAIIRKVAAAWQDAQNQLELFEVEGLLQTLPKMEIAVSELDSHNDLSVNLYFNIARDWSDEELTKIYNFAEYIDSNFDKLEELFAQTLATHLQAFLDRRSSDLSSS